MFKFMSRAMAAVLTPFARIPLLRPRRPRGDGAA
jgi:hypothetical protein